MATGTVQDMKTSGHEPTLIHVQKRPLYLHITSKTREGLDAAVAKLEALMSQDLPNLVDERRFRRREPEPFERDELGRVRLSPVLLGARLDAVLTSALAQMA